MNICVLLKSINIILDVVLDEAKEYTYNEHGEKTETINLDSILLNGNQIAMIIPGADPQ